MTAPAATRSELIVARILVRQAAARAASVDELRDLARDAVKAGVWCPRVRADFTARRLKIERQTP